MPKKAMKSVKKISLKLSAKNEAKFAEKLGQNGAAPEATTITLRTDTGQSFSLRSSKKLEQAAMAWRSIVRNRRRWADAKTSRDEQAQNAHKQLLDLLMAQPPANESEECPAPEQQAQAEAKIAQLAKASFIEVSIPFKSEKAGWETRVMPWEYLLAAATKVYRQERSLIVIRHLERHSRPSTGTPEKVLMIESAPGKVREVYNFEAERKLLQSSLALSNTTYSTDETQDLLQQRIKTFQPDVIHLTGIDTHLGLNLGVWEAESRAEFKDGYLMTGDDRQITSVGAEALATLLNAGRHKPQLVACNIYHSAARIASLVVAKGAAASIGFQDEFADSLTELFFSDFYLCWRHFNWNLLEAFNQACQTLREQPKGLSGTGVVLWSSESLLQKRLHAAAATTTPPAVGATRGVAIQSTPDKAEIEKQIREEKSKILPVPQTEEEARETLTVELKVNPTLNYAMLHNNCPLFDTFLIRKAPTGTANHVDVSVTLYVGAQQASYTGSFSITESPFDLNDKVRIPLLASAWAEINESAVSTLEVHVRWGSNDLYRMTHPVTLLTLDEWRDDGTNSIWLPSFVLPRDGAVRRVVDSAQRYLMALRDDSSAGFDGYQSFDYRKDLSPDEAAELVDAQVRALWSALIYENSIGYINPPPTFTDYSQRLRSPSEIIEGRRGTCIDTTLLLAACLEYVEIYPVIFLLKGHAFVGYWRSDAYHSKFYKVVEKLQNDASKPRKGWYFESQLYDLIMEQVRAMTLVPLESTWLTMRGSFSEAVEEGAENFRNPKEFEAMLDVIKSREGRQVTPIPLRGKQ
jgi:hypothetical protein